VVHAFAEFFQREKPRINLESGEIQHLGMFLRIEFGGIGRVNIKDSLTGSVGKTTPRESAVLRSLF
jgi:hypothetical protein